VFVVVSSSSNNNSRNMVVIIGYGAVDILNVTAITIKSLFDVDFLVNANVSLCSFYVTYCDPLFGPRSVKHAKTRNVGQCPT